MLATPARTRRAAAPAVTPPLLFDPAAVNHHTEGEWVVSSYPPGYDMRHPKGEAQLVKQAATLAEMDARKSTVIVRFQGREWHRDHGRPAYDGAVDLIRHLHRTGYVPKEVHHHCLADLTPAERRKSCLADAASEQGGGICS